MVVLRGQIWWADLGEPRGSSPGYERPVVILQSDSFNKTELNTVIVAIMTSNLRLAQMPGNVVVSMRTSGLESDSIINITQLFTLDRTDLIEYLGALPENKINQIGGGLRLVLDL